MRKDTIFLPSTRRRQSQVQMMHVSGVVGANLGEYLPRDHLEHYVSIVPAQVGRRTTCLVLYGPIAYVHALMFSSGTFNIII